jgi:DNA-binding beta-propeller fold protein YncE
MVDDFELDTELRRYAQVLREVSAADLHRRIMTRVASAPPRRRRAPAILRQVAVAVTLLAFVAALPVGVAWLRAVRQLTPETDRPVTAPPPVAPAAGSQVAWLLARQPGQPPGAVSIDPAGHVARTEATEAYGLLRSPDGKQFYAVAGDKLNVYDAATGQKVRTISRPSSVAPRALAVSHDAHYLALVELRSSQPAGSSRIRPGSIRLEIVDLEAGRGVVGLDLGSITIGDNDAWIHFSPDARHLYIYTGPLGKLTAIAFDGADLKVELEGSWSDGTCYRTLPSSDRVLPDGRTLVTFSPCDGAIKWVDLGNLAITHNLKASLRGPSQMTWVYSPDGGMLYLHEPSTGLVQAVDLRRHEIVRKVTLPATTASSTFQRLAQRLVTTAEAGGGLTPETAAISPDGQWLYIVQSNRGPGGVWVVHLPDLAFRTTWVPNIKASLLWVSGDGRSLYVLGEARDKVFVLDSGGRLAATAVIGGGNLGELFVPPWID